MAVMIRSPHPFPFWLRRVVVSFVTLVSSGFLLFWMNGVIAIEQARSWPRTIPMVSLVGIVIGCLWYLHRIRPRIWEEKGRRKVLASLSTLSDEYRVLYDVHLKHQGLSIVLPFCILGPPGVIVLLSDDRPATFTITNDGQLIATHSSHRPRRSRQLQKSQYRKKALEKWLHDMLLPVQEGSLHAYVILSNPLRLFGNKDVCRVLCIEDIPKSIESLPCVWDEATCREVTRLMIHSSLTKHTLLDF